jgi:hypothetical protein
LEPLGRRRGSNSELGSQLKAHGKSADTKSSRAQEKLYLIWRAGRLDVSNATDWAESLVRLQAEGDCDYFCWLMRVQAQVH